MWGVPVAVPVLSGAGAGLGTGTILLLFLSATPGREGRTHLGQNPLSRLCHSFPSTLLILKAERKKNAALETQNTSENAARRD